MSLIEAGWDTDVARRPHGQRTTVVVHLDLEARVAALHLGPLLSESERRYLLCDATCEVWFERDGQVIGSGRDDPADQPSAAPRPRTPRPLLRGARLRGHPRSARPSHPTLGRRRPHRAGQPGAGLPLPPPGPPSRHHHHHRTRPQLTVTDSTGRPLSDGSLARPPTKPPPAVAPCHGTSGERADWWWYQPFQPQPPPTNN